MYVANRLTEKIVIKRPTRVPNGSGGFTTEYTTILSPFAEVKNKSVSNDLIAQGSDLIEVYDILIRYRQDVIITKSDIIEWRGRRFEIIGLPPGFVNREYIKITAHTLNESTSNGL